MAIFFPGPPHHRDPMTSQVRVLLIFTGILYNSLYIILKV